MNIEQALQVIANMANERSRYRLALEKICSKSPAMVRQAEAADMAIEFQLYARGALGEKVHPIFAPDIDSDSQVGLAYTLERQNHE